MGLEMGLCTGIKQERERREWWSWLIRMSEKSLGLLMERELHRHGADQISDHSQGHPRRLLLGQLLDRL